MKVTENNVTKLDKKKATNTILIINEETLVTVTMINPTTTLIERGKRSQAEKTLSQGNLLRRAAETVRESQTLPRS